MVRHMFCKYIYIHVDIYVNATYINIYILLHDEIIIYLGEELERWFRLLFEIITILYYYNTTYFPIKWCKTVKPVKTVNFNIPILIFP